MNPPNHKPDEKATLVLSCPVCTHSLQLQRKHLGIKGNCVSCGAGIMAVEHTPGEMGLVLVEPTVSRPSEIDASQPNPEEPQSELPKDSNSLPKEEPTLAGPDQLDSPLTETPASDLVSHLNEQKEIHESVSKSMPDTEQAVTLQGGEPEDSNGEFDGGFLLPEVFRPPLVEIVQGNQINEKVDRFTGTLWGFDDPSADQDSSMHWSIPNASIPTNGTSDTEPLKEEIPSHGRAFESSSTEEEPESISPKPAPISASSDRKQSDPPSLPPEVEKPIHQQSSEAMLPQQSGVDSPPLNEEPLDVGEMEKSSESGFTPKSETAPIKSPFEDNDHTIPDADTGPLAARSFMDRVDVNSEPETNESASDGLSEFPSDSEVCATITPLSLKPDKVKRNRISTEMFLLILFLASVTIGFCTYMLTPDEKINDYRERIGEWLEPGTVLIEKLPLENGKKPTGETGN